MKILDSDNLGLKSRVVQSDNAFLGFKASNLVAAQMWEEGIAFVKNLYAISNDEERLKALREIDDWSIWSVLVSATKNAKTPG